MKRVEYIVKSEWTRFTTYIPCPLYSDFDKLLDPRNTRAGISMECAEFIAAGLRAARPNGRLSIVDRDAEIRAYLAKNRTP